MYIAILSFKQRDHVVYIHLQMSYDIDVRVNVFEANIRMLGGLLSAHLLAQDPVRGPLLMPGGYNNGLLVLAEDLGSRLLPAFTASPTGEQLILLVKDWLCVVQSARQMSSCGAVMQSMALRGLSCCFTRSWGNKLTVLTVFEVLRPHQVGVPQLDCNKKHVQVCHSPGSTCGTGSSRTRVCMKLILQLLDPSP